MGLRWWWGGRIWGEREWEWETKEEKEMIWLVLVSCGRTPNHLFPTDINTLSIIACSIYKINGKIIIYRSLIIIVYRSPKAQKVHNVQNFLPQLFVRRVICTTFQMDRSLPAHITSNFHHKDYRSRRVVEHNPVGKGVRVTLGNLNSSIKYLNQRQNQF